MGDSILSDLTGRRKLHVETLDYLRSENARRLHWDGHPGPMVLSAMIIAGAYLICQAMEYHIGDEDMGGRLVWLIVAWLEFMVAVCGLYLAQILVCLFLPSRMLRHWVIASFVLGILCWYFQNRLAALVLAQIPAWPQASHFIADAILIAGSAVILGLRVGKTHDDKRQQQKTTDKKEPGAH